MNVTEFNPGTYGTIARYVKATLLLTIATIWIVMAWLSPHLAMWQRLLWPITLPYRHIRAPWQWWSSPSGDKYELPLWRYSKPNYYLHQVNI
jgi:hypothetical protein